MGIVNLDEYLYVDRARLDAYFEQISGPVKYDKVPVWKAALSLTGLSAETTQSRNARPFTLHEKVQAFEAFLRREQMVKKGRERDPSSEDISQTFGSDQAFRSEKMCAQRVLVKLKEPIEGRDSLALWYSEALDGGNDRVGRGPVLLIEDYLGRDDEPCLRVSSCSALYLLFSSMDKRFLESDGISDDPITLLKEAGAVFGPTRKVSVLYRVRAVGLVISGYHNCLSFTVGYPIVVTSWSGFFQPS